MESVELLYIQMEVLKTSQDKFVEMHEIKKIHDKFEKYTEISWHEKLEYHVENKVDQDKFDALSLKFDRMIEKLSEYTTTE